MPIEQSPSGQLVVVDGYVWTSGERGLLRIDPRTDTVDRVIPRSVLGVGATDRVWVTSDADLVLHRPAPASCGGRTCVTGRGVAEIQLPTSCFELTADTDDVWIGGTSFEGDRSWLHRIDARTNAPTGSWRSRIGGHLPVVGAGAVWLDTVARGASGSRRTRRRPRDRAAARGDGAFVSAFGSGAFWTTCEAEQVVVRIDAESLVVEELAAGPGVDALAVADGTLWVSNSDAGTVMRFDVEPWRTEGDR